MSDIQWRVPKSPSMQWKNLPKITTKIANSKSLAIIKFKQKKKKKKNENEKRKKKKKMPKMKMKIKRQRLSKIFWRVQ